MKEQIKSRMTAPRSAGRGVYQWVLEAAIAVLMFGSLIIAIVKIGG